MGILVSYLNFIVMKHNSQMALPREARLFYPAHEETLRITS